MATKPATNGATKRAAVFKRLIVCCDGTWQSSDKPGVKENVESNVTRLCRALKDERYVDSENQEIQQVVYYQSGVGTDELSKLAASMAGESFLRLSVVCWCCEMQWGGDLQQQLCIGHSFAAPFFF